ncbi:ead/Ea22-like family protein [Raoultella terrigena]|uniref:hypothetical protein n=1 Tax=Raoultella terrigena TaxID=577 RepID=UPI0038508457
MTTDITELAQSLKAAAPNVTTGPWVVKDYFWLTPESEVFSGEFVECHNGPDAQFLKLLSPDNILALVEALENSESRLHEVAVACATAEQALGLKEEQRANWFQMAQKLGEDLDAAENRIAELESRTVTVKLPDIMPPEAAPAHYWGSGESMAYADGYNKSTADLKTSFAQSCSSAGVNVEFE